MTPKMTAHFGLVQQILASLSKSLGSENAQLIQVMGNIDNGDDDDEMMIIMVMILMMIIIIV